MCKDCGCEDGHPHSHTHSHDGQAHTHEHHHHGDVNGHTHEHTEEPRVVEVEKKVLAKNDDIAAANRKYFSEKGIVAINLISSPGSGKTTLLEKTLDALKGEVSCAVIAGDQRTDNDARRLKGKGAEVVQIETANACHLNAEQISRVLPELIGEDTGLLFIENVGNLVCPAAFDLGETFKIALLSTTEGEDKPLKYPSLFTDSRLVLLTKTDLAPHLDWDRDLCRKNIRQVQPGVLVFELSALSGKGMDKWIEYLKNLTT